MKYLFLIAICIESIFFQSDSSLYESNADAFLKSAIANQVIDARNPNYELLDAALFQASNLQRKKYRLPLFSYSPILHRIASEHSEAMISKNFYSHENPYSKNNRNLSKRVLSQTNEFSQMAENIAEFDIIQSKYDTFCIIEPKRKGGDFQYIDCDTEKVIPMQTYKELATNIVNEWMSSPGHRANLLNKNYKVMGCAIRLSKNPYKTENSPFSRITQNFGG